MSHRFVLAFLLLLSAAPVGLTQSDGGTSAVCLNLLNLSIGGSPSHQHNHQQSDSSPRGDDTFLGQLFACQQGPQAH